MATQWAVDLVFKSQTKQLNDLQRKLSQLEVNLNKIKGGKPFKPIEDGAQNAGVKVNGLVKTLGKLALAYGALRAGQAAISAGINRIESERRIQFLAQGYGEAAQLAQAAAEAARRFGVSQTEANEALATTYARLRPVGVSLEEIKGIYAGFSTAARISGASATEAEGAFRQLAQGLGSGALRGDEFNSVAEQVPLILTAVSKETGIAQGALRDYAAEGKITSDVVIRALKRIEKEGADQLEAALDGPQQKIKDFQNASEDLAVAFSRELVPEMTGAISELAQTLRDLIPILREIGRVAAAVFKYIGGLARRINDMMNGARMAQAELQADTQAQKQTRDKFGVFGSLTKEAQEYRAAVKKAQLLAAKDALNPIPELSAAAAPDFGGGSSPTGGGGGKGGKGGKGGGVDQTAQLQQQLALKRQLFAIEQQMQAAILAGDKVAEQNLERKRIEAELDNAIIEAKGNGLKVEIARLEAAEQLANLEFKTAEQEKKRKESLDEVLTRFDREIELAGIKGDEAKKLKQIEYDILDLRKQGLLVGDEEIEKYRQRAQAAAQAGGGDEGKIQAYMNKLQEELDDTEGMITSLAQTIEGELGSAMSSAITGLIDGTKTAQEAFSDMFKNIGKAFIDMATQMIAKYVMLIAMQALFKALGGPSLGGGGGDTFSQGLSMDGTLAGGGVFSGEGPYKFAEGGYVTGPTNALIGEAGESEYVIPSSKMGAAMANYKAGKRGGSVVSDAAGGSEAQNGGNNTFTLETVVINSVEYATVDQVRAMSRQAAKQGAEGGYTKTLGSLRNSRATRARIGMG